MKAAGVSRPLVVADTGGDRAGVVSVLEQAGLRPLLFAGAEPNPTDTNCQEGAAEFHAHSADSVVAVGGGSALDCGKCIAMVAGSHLEVRELEWTLPTPDLGSNVLPPVWTLPTTAGTGAEMDAPSMLTLTSERRKLCLTHSSLRIHAVIDPELTLTLPANLTAWTGMDALTHALEALSVDAYHPMCDGIALEALRLIDTWLPTAFEDGSHLEARSNMLAASAMAAVAFQKGLGAVHGLSEPIGAVHNTQHGLTNAIILPIVLQANREVIRPKCELVANYLTLPPPKPGYSQIDDGFTRVCCWVDSLSKRLDIPTSLREIGLSEANVAELAVKAEANPTGWDNPIRFDAASYERICHSALEGHDRSRLGV